MLGSHLVRGTPPTENRKVDGLATFRLKMLLRIGGVERSHGLLERGFLGSPRTPRNHEPQFERVLSASCRNPVLKIWMTLVQLAGLTCKRLQEHLVLLGLEARLQNCQ